MSSQRRIEALRARAERGSTEGERNAARIALGKSLAKRTLKTSADSWSRQFLHTEPEPYTQYTPPQASHRAESHTESSARVEVGTNAEMHRRFKDNDVSGLSFRWRGRVRTALRLSGYVHDRGRVRFFVIVQLKNMGHA